MSTQRGRRRRLPSTRSLQGSGLLGAALALTGALLMACQAPADTSTDTTAPLAAERGKPVADRQGGDRPQLDPETASVPISVTIPKAKAPIDPVTTIQNGELQLPGTAQIIAWWAGGAAPGEKTGVISLAGHVNTRTEKSGVFTRLAQLKPGDKVHLKTYGGKLYSYVVTKPPKQYDKSGLPAELFDPNAKHQLALITCSGKWNPKTRAYPKNLIVWAVPAP